MADSTTTRNIKFNFDDAGSLKKVKQMYEDFEKSLVQRSSIYAQNTGGGFGTSQNRYIKEEIELVRQLGDARKKEHDNRVRLLNELTSKESIIDDKYKKGLIGGGEAQGYLADIENERKKLLSGTGYRKEHTYMKGMEAIISGEQNEIKKLESLLEKTNSTLKDILSNDKVESMKMIDAIEQDDNSTPEQRIAAMQARNELEKIDSRRKERERPERGILQSLLTSENLNQLFSNVRQIGGSNSAMELFRNTSNAGMNTINTIGDAFGPWGTGISRAITSIMGVAVDHKMNQMHQLDSLDKSMFANRALMGGGLIYPTQTSQYGLSYSDFTGTFDEMARASGTKKGVHQTAYDALTMNKGIGIDNQVITTLLQITRANAENDKDLKNIIGGISQSAMFKNDRSFLNEFLTQNFSVLQKQLQQNQTSVNSGTVFGLLSTFNSIGGQFAANHPNSMGLLSNINNALTNPQSDSMDALTFTALRREMPGASLLDILGEREKGIGSSKYLKGFLSQLSLMGGSEENQILQLSKALGLNIDASKDLFYNKDKILNMTEQDRLKYLGSFEGEAASNTTALEKIEAEYKNNITTGMGIKEAAQMFAQAFELVFSGRTFTYDIKNQVLTETFAPVKNATKTPQQAAIQTGIQNAKQPFYTSGMKY